MSHFIQVMFADSLLVAQERVTVINASITTVSVRLFDRATIR
jgi:hypothetical protein